MTHPTAIGSFLMLVTLLQSGCAHETRIGALASDRPNWTLIDPPQANGRVYFVGRSLAQNVLDEKNAIISAKHDATYQIALALGVHVTGTYTTTDTRDGSAIQGRGTNNQTAEDKFVATIDTKVSDIQPDEVFWERYCKRRSKSAAGGGAEQKCGTP